MSDAAKRKLDLLIAVLLILGAFFPELSAGVIWLTPKLTHRQLATQAFDLTLWGAFSLFYLPATLALLATASGVFQGILWARWLGLIAGITLLIVGAILRGNAGFAVPILTIAALCFALFLNGWRLQKRI